MSSLLNMNKALARAGDIGAPEPTPPEDEADDERTMDESLALEFASAVSDGDPQRVLSAFEALYRRVSGR